MDFMSGAMPLGGCCLMLSKRGCVVPRQYIIRIEPVTALDDLPAAAPISGLGRNQRFTEHLIASFFSPTSDDVEAVAIGPAGGLAFPPVCRRQRRP